MLRKPGLVALYDIWSGNGAGLFLQPRSPHGAANILEDLGRLQLLLDAAVSSDEWRDGDLCNLKNDVWKCRRLHGFLFVNSSRYKYWNHVPRKRQRSHAKLVLSIKFIHDFFTYCCFTYCFFPFCRLPVHAVHYWRLFCDYVPYKFMVDIALTVKLLTACLVWHRFLIALSYYTLS